MVYVQYLLILQYPLVAHFSILQGISDLKFFALAALVVGILLRALIRLDVVALISALVIIGGLAAIWFLGYLDLISYLPPIIIPAVLLVVFGSTLLPGREPLVTGIGEQARGPLSPEMRLYTRRVTWLWALTFLMLLTEAIGLLVIDQIILWSWLMYIINPILMVVLFVGEFVFRKIRFPDHAHPTFPDYIRIVRQARQP